MSAGAGLMPFSIDGTPIVGELSETGYPGLWLATGFGPEGIMEGPAAGRWVGEQVVAQQQLDTNNSQLGTAPVINSVITDNESHRALTAALSGATPKRFFPRTGDNTAVPQ